jgi:hypothetical protein
MTTTRNFSLTDLLALAIVSAILVSLPVLAVGTRTALERRATCVANLNSFGKAVPLYMNENDDRTPIMDMRMLYDPANVSVPSVETQTNDEYADGTWETTFGTNPMQNVWLLIYQNMLQVGHFRCPADQAYLPREETVTDPSDYGWVSPFNYSYGLHVPYSSGNNPVPFNANAPGALVISADQVPYDNSGYHVVDAEADPVKSPSNHGDLGTVFVTFTGSVRHTDVANSRCGMEGDEIYANATSEIIGGIPETDNDTSIAKSGRFESIRAPSTEDGDPGP